MLKKIIKQKRFILGRYFSQNSLNNDVIIITGGSSGIGEEIAIKYSKNNLNIILASRRENKLKEVEKKCYENGANKVNIIKCDVSNENDCKYLINETIKLYNKIDILVLNAGIGQVSSFIISLFISCFFISLLLLIF